MSRLQKEYEIGRSEEQFNDQGCLYDIQIFVLNKYVLG